MRIPPLAAVVCSFSLLVACEASTTPSSAAVGQDSGFRLYTVSIWHDAPYTDEFTLDSAGNARRVVGHLDTLDTLRAVLTSSELVRVKSLLETSASRHPTSIPYPFQLVTVLDSTGKASCDTAWIDGGSTTSRTIAYSDGSSSSMSAHSAVQQLPDSWTALDPVDSLLAAVFPK